MSVPCHLGEPLTAATQAEVRRRAIFDCCKWDPQIEDLPALVARPLLIGGAVWRELARLASALAAETLAMERELLERQDLLRHLGLPRPFHRGLCRLREKDPGHVSPRVMRFDFHWTTEGWRISEANSDVPGGLIEAGAVSRLVATHYPGTTLTGDVVETIVEAFGAAVPSGGRVGLVHATGFADDRQVMVHLAGRLARAGLRPHLAAPDHLSWIDGRPLLPTEWGGMPLDALFRFFPAEWLPNLPRRARWQQLLDGAGIPLCNPASALITQSKRLPLVWDALTSRRETWQTLLPETCDPREVDWACAEDWVLKPALGRVGDLVGVPGATRQPDWRTIRRLVRWHPAHWVAQRRFQAVAVELDGEPAYPCLGVYTVGTQACGIYGRIARRALIDHLAQDVAVLMIDPAPSPGAEPEPQWKSAYGPHPTL